jgi:hypothetical protein
MTNPKGNQQTEGNRKHKNKKGKGDKKDANNVGEGKNEKRKVKFPCKLCTDDQLSTNSIDLRNPKSYWHNKNLPC